MSTEKKPIKLLFFAWGYSIHAERRIGAFTGDDRFEVWLASTHNYENLQVHKIYLSGALQSVADKYSNDTGDRLPTTGNQNKLSLRGMLVRKLKNVLLGWRWFLLLYLALYEMKTIVQDYVHLACAVRRIEPDVIFAQTLMYPACLPLFLPKRYPLIVTFWNGDILFWAAYKGLERRLKKWLVTAGIRRARAITVNSVAMQNKVFDLGGDGRKVYLIRYPGIDRSLFLPGPRQEAQHRIGLTEGRVILCPRGLGGYLNTEFILQAAVKVLAEYPDALFVFLGAWGEPNLIRHQQIATELGIAERMVWAGRVSWTLMPDYFRAAEVIISISSEDSLPNCMIEGMACGIPLILGDIPQLKEWVEDGRNAFLVPPQDANALAGKIKKLLSGAVAAEVELYTDFNLKLVTEYFDSQKNVEQVKQLVCAVAGSQRERMV